MNPLSRPIRCNRFLRPMRDCLLASAMLLALTGIATAADFAGDFVYTVREGDNPWNLTERFLKSVRHWPRLQAYNGIEDARRIRPGSTLRIPQAWLKTSERSARIIDVHGEAVAVRDGESQMLAKDARLGSGTLIRTSADSSAILEFPDRSRSQIGPEAEVHLDAVREVRLSGAQQVELRLARGRMDNAVEALGSGHYLVRTPAAVAAVRGTRFRVGADDDAMRTEALDGGVDIRNAQGRVRLSAGLGTLATVGQRPQAATKLLPAPRLDEVPAQIDRIPFRHPLPALAGATAYRTQILTRSDPAAIAADATAPDLLINSDLADGDYLIRVRAIDERGIEGIDAEREIIIDARPEPPFPNRPALDARVSDERIVFTWTRGATASSDHFQLAADAQFSQLIEDRTGLDEGRFELDKELPPGRYYWRLARATVDEGRGPFSDAQAFYRPPPGPTIEEPEIGDRLLLRWRASDEGSRYQVQLSRTVDFASPEFDLETDQPQLEIPRPPPGSYHVRIRSLPAQLSPGPWGAPQLVEIPENPWHALLILAPLLLLGL